MNMTLETVFLNNYTNQSFQPSNPGTVTQCKNVPVKEE